jgi:hypothetical protein
MVMRMYYWEALKQKEEAEGLLDSLPVASLQEIEVADAGNSNHYQAVINEKIKDVVGVVSGKYQLVQHKEAFQPIVEALNSIGASYRMNIGYTQRKAWMSIVTNSEATDGVSIGFQALNSIDGTTAIRYGFANFKQTRWVELVGYRQVCSNGMVVRVPLDNAEFVKLEEREKIEVLLRETARIIHMGKAHDKVEAIRYIVEAMELLKEPVARMIEASKNKILAEKMAKELIAKYLGKRLNKKVLAQYRKEEKNLWGLYNAMTFVASHNKEIATSSADSLLNGSAEMLREELVAKAD